MMSSGQHHRGEQANRENLPEADPSQAYPQADPSQANAQIHHDPTAQSTRAGGTDVIGEPVNPLHDPASHGAHAAANPPSYTDSVNHPTSQTQAPSNASYTLGPTDGSFPTAQPPRSLSSAAPQQEAPAAPQQEAPKTPSGQARTANPYVQTSSTTTDSTASKSPMDSIMQVFNKWGKKAEGVTGNVWNHLRTGPNIADTAMGRIALGAKAMSEGGLEKVFRQMFDVAPDEHLLKTYACYLSTSTGPVAGTLYISSHKLAFCSDRPLAVPGSSPQADPQNNTSTPTGSTDASTTSPTSNKSSASTTSPTSNKSSASQQFYYKVMVPISQVESVNPSENTEKKPTEKYVEVKTTDGHEFWFMGFVNYDKGVKNLQETLRNKDSSTGTIDASQLDKDTTPATTYGNQLDMDTTPATTGANQREMDATVNTYGNQLDKDTTPARTYGNQLERDTTPGANQLDKDTTPATTYGNQLDRDTTPTTTDANQLERDTTPPTTYGNQLDRDTTPATTGANQLERDTTPATSYGNQLDRDSTPATTGGRHVAE